MPTFAIVSLRPLRPLRPFRPFRPFLSIFVHSTRSLIAPKNDEFLEFFEEVHYLRNTMFS